MTTTWYFQILHIYEYIKVPIKFSLDFLFCNSHDMKYSVTYDTPIKWTKCPASATFEKSISNKICSLRQLDFLDCVAFRVDYDVWASYTRDNKNIKSKASHDWTWLWIDITEGQF